MPLNQASRSVHGTNRHVGNALSQLPTDRRRVDQKPFGAHPRSPEVHTGGAHGRTGQWYATARRTERFANKRHSGLETGIQSSFDFPRYML